MVISNVVPKEKLREVQSKTLKEIKDVLACSFGPMGTNSCLKMDKGPNQYSKDGHTILSRLCYNGVIEQSVKEDIEDITRYITITVGDGTTSAVILSQILFEKFNEYEKDHNIAPYKLIEIFKDVVADIKKGILERAREATPEDMYKIALISTNSNKEVSENIANIYKEFGTDVFIDVAASTGQESFIKIYDGMTLNSGYADICFINNPVTNTCTIDHPDIYIFQDPVDTPEMVGLFDHIIAENIVAPWNQHDMQNLIPTVIVAPKLSRDMSSFMADLSELMVKVPTVQRPPLCVITNIIQEEELHDIAKLSGCVMIKKYIDPDLQKKDVESGVCPTIDTICDGGFNGYCDSFTADSNTSKFIRPANMFNDDGSNSDIYDGLLTFLKNALTIAKNEGQDASVTGKLKRRIHSLEGHMVEYLVGGVSMSDRDSLRDLVEDAVLNCRSAAANGVGYAANYEGLKVSMGITCPDGIYDKTYYEIVHIIQDAYIELTRILYATIGKKLTDDEIGKMITRDMGPINLVTGAYDKTALSSIMSDIVVLETISKIVSLMFTCNQFIVPNPVHNIYVDI